MQEGGYRVLLQDLMGVDHNTLEGVVLTKWCIGKGVISNIGPICNHVCSAEIL